MSRHMFFGGNTPEGFYGVFEDILFLEEAKKIIYLKGSSGSGKSTLMRKVAAAFEEKGMEVDYIHCSNNVTDLDGICIREKGFCMVDATAPHVCDPTVPIAVDEIFNLGDFIGRDYVKGYGSELLELQKQKKPFYIKAYNYLNAAYKIYGNSISIYEQTLDQVKLRTVIEKECEYLYQKKIGDKPGRNRRMLASAISPQGMVSYLDSLIKDQKIIALKGEKGMGMDHLLSALRDMANSRGYHTESCMCSLNKEKMDHLLIPELNLAYVTLNTYHQTERPPERTIDFQKCCNRKLSEEEEKEVEYNRKIFGELLHKAMNMMDAQKIVHDQIEKIYVASMDFDGLNGAFEKVMEIFRGSEDI